MFYDAETLLMRANKFRRYYGCNATDITGGEATIYHDPRLAARGLKGLRTGGRNEHLEYLVEHCANIGLAPSIITHGQNLSELLVKAIEALGLDTWEISIHGLGVLNGKHLGDGHKRLVVVRKGGGLAEQDGGFQRMIDGAGHCTRPIRWNSTVVDQTLRELPGVARFLVDRYPPVTYNMIQFMPYHGHTTNDAAFQKKYSECAPFIAEAVRIVEAQGWECNVRYFPPCVAHEHGFARNCLMHYQTQRDWAEWNYAATIDAEMQFSWDRVQMGEFPADEFWKANAEWQTRICDGHTFKRRPFCPPCETCAARRICEGPDMQYSKRFGTDELRPFTGPDFGLPDGALVIDPMAFSKLGRAESLVQEAP